MVAQWAFIGGLTFLLRHFLADISKESPTKYYAVWSVSLTISLVISALPDILRGGAFEAPLVILIVAGLVGGLIFGAAFKKAGFD